MTPYHPSTYHKPTFSGKLMGHLAKWRDDPERSDAYLFVMAVIVGLVMGVVSTIFRWLIIQSHHLFQGHENQQSVFHKLPESWQAPITLFLPALGGLIVGLLIYKVLKLGGGHGVPSVMKAVATGKVNLSPSMAIKSASSPITITSGGSSGPEGPIVEIGAVIGSYIGNFAKVRKDQVGTLVGCGAAAGIAAIFGAPIGGVIFSLELIMRDFQVRKFAPVVVAAVIAAVTSTAILPNNPAFVPLSVGILHTIQPSLTMVIHFTILGVLCGCVGSLLVWTLYYAHDIFHSIKIPLWTKPAIGGLILGVLGYFFPQILGEGYGTVNDMILSVTTPEITTSLIGFFVLLCVLKVLATSLTLGSGGTGGTFAPAMVCGALLGAGVGLLFESIMPSFSADYRIFAMVGMAGVVGSALGTPLAALLIIYEVAGGQYRLVLPLMITVALASLTSSFIKKGSVYTITLLRDGFDVEAVQMVTRDPLSELPISDVMNEEIITFRPFDTLQRILEVLADSHEDAFVVSDEHGDLKGIISTSDLRAVAMLGELGAAAVIAGDIADTNPPTLLPTDPASNALDIFSSSDIEGIPVLENEQSSHVIGMVYRGTVLRAYKQSASNQS